MGVPGFFLWLIKNYNKKIIISKTIDINIDYLLIDTNCLIHPICFEILDKYNYITNLDILENKMINAILEYIKYIIKFVNPQKSIYIAIDGVAPMAKIKQQRMRRYKSINDNRLFNNIKKKHNIPIKNFWNNSAITPGTFFMKKLHNKILELKKSFNIIYSSCYTPAEGEHKLLQFIKNNMEYSYVIYGLDADLIFLSLASGNDKIFLLREGNEIDNKSDKDFKYVNMKILKDSIVSTMKDNILKDENKILNSIIQIETNLINDFIFICYFLGNDFLPHFPSLDIYNDATTHLIKNYCKTLNDLGKNLLDNNKFNIKFLKLFLKNLSISEHDILKTQYYTTKKYKSCDGNLYEKELFKIENLQFTIYDPIKLGYDEYELYRIRYYKHYWDINENELEDFVKNLVEEYLIGLKWVTQYYFKECPSWDWYYPYDHPPFIGDLYKYFININKIDFILGIPIDPLLQLLLVLPPQSSYLLPQSLKKFMKNPKLEILYPLQIQQDFLYKRKYWQGIPDLPNLNIKIIKKYYNKIELKEEKEYNKVLDIFM
jgi:5'-3' exonuclease